MMQRRAPRGGAAARLGSFEIWSFPGTGQRVCIEYGRVKLLRKFQELEIDPVPTEQIDLERN